MRRRRVAAGAALTLALAVIGTELALPSFAEKKVRDELATVGAVTDVEVSSSPAVMMLFGGVESAAVRLSSATVDGDTVDPGMLDRAGAVDELDVRIETLRAGPFDAESVVLRKRGEDLDASATLDVDQIESLVPGARLVVRDGDLLLRLSDLPLPLPMPGPIRLQIGVEDGTVVARPLGALAALMPPQPLMDRPELSVTGLRSSIADGAVTVTATGTLEEL